MKIEHECEQCYLKDLCKNYLYNKSFLIEFKSEYYDYDFLSLKLHCTHKHGNTKFSSGCNCEQCANRPICTLGSYKQGDYSGGAQIKYLKTAASQYISNHFRDAFVGTLCCKGYIPEDKTVVSDPLGGAQ